ncbi:MAG: hypothetical protein H0V24_12750 [Chloroflexia bacterium]|nr:hypothetical protein [Chloroflexia bacterium]
MTLATLPLATGSLAAATNRTINQRSNATATNTEKHIMYPGSINIAHVHADERRKDMFREAAYERQVQQAERASRSTGRASNVRHRFGVVLVNLGQRLQHAQPAANAGAPLGTLRTAR